MRHVVDQRVDFSWKVPGEEEKISFRKAITLSMFYLCLVRVKIEPQFHFEPPPIIVFVNLSLNFSKLFASKMVKIVSALVLLSMR